MKINELLHQGSRSFIVISGFLLVVLAGAMDYMTGVEPSFAIFYLIPVFLVGSLVNLPISIVISFASAATLLIVDLISHPHYSNPVIPYWNAIAQLFYFLILSYILFLRHEAEKASNVANESLRSWVGHLERRNREITSLAEMADLLQTCATADEAHTVIAKSAQRIFSDSSGALCITSASRNLLEAVATWGEFQGQRVFSPNDCWGLRLGRVHVVEDPVSGLLCRHLQQTTLGGFLCIPMTAQGETLGMLHLQTHSRENAASHELGRHLMESEHRLGVAVTEQVALALSNLKLRETLRSQAIRDPLTGLFNRRYLEETMEREIGRALRSGSSLGVVMIDIDNFKAFNDRFRHEAGDVLLRELGYLLKARIRGEDIACRYGGEEFILLLPGVALDEVERRAEQVRKDVKHLNVQHLGQSLDTITLSMGVATYPIHGSRVEDILRAADTALYRAKAEGRDRVVVAEVVVRAF